MGPGVKGAPISRKQNPRALPPPLHLDLLARADLGELAQLFAQFLQERQQLKYSSIANYMNGLAAVVGYVYESGGFELPDEVASSERSPLTQIINLRNQAEKASRTQQLYEKRVGGWITWEEAQQARVRAVAEFTDYEGRDRAQRRGLLRDAAAGDAHYTSRDDAHAIALGVGGSTPGGGPPPAAMAAMAAASTVGGAASGCAGGTPARGGSPSACHIASPCDSSSGRSAAPSSTIESASAGRLLACLLYTSPSPRD